MEEESNPDMDNRGYINDYSLYKNTVSKLYNTSEDISFNLNEIYYLLKFVVDTIDMHDKNKIRNFIWYHRDEFIEKKNLLSDTIYLNLAQRERIDKL